MQFPSAIQPYSASLRYLPVHLRPRQNISLCIMELSINWSLGIKYGSLMLEKLHQDLMNEPMFNQLRTRLQLGLASSLLLLLLRDSFNDCRWQLSLRQWLLYWSRDSGNISNFTLVFVTRIVFRFKFFAQQTRSFTDRTRPAAPRVI